jgi:hypothetical protein
MVHTAQTKLIPIDLMDGDPTETETPVTPTPEPVPDGSAGPVTIDPGVIEQVPTTPAGGEQGIEKKGSGGPVT